MNRVGIRMVLGPSSSAGDLTPLDSGNQKTTRGRWGGVGHVLLQTKQPTTAGQWHLLGSLKQERPHAN